MSEHTDHAALIDLIGQEARRLRVGQKLPPSGPLTWEQIKAVQEDFEHLLQQPGVNLERVAKAMGQGFSRGPLSKFRGATGPDAENIDLQRVARGLNRFMETIGRRREQRLPQGFVQTQVARRMLTVIGKCAELVAFGIITGDAGRGKSLTLSAAEMIYPGAILVRVRQSTRRAFGLSRAISDRLNLPSGKVSHIVQARVTTALKGSGRLLMIDEAHRLQHDALELLRDIHDEAAVGIVLCGTSRVTELVSDTSVFYGQFLSRVALKYDISEDLLRAGSGPGGPDGGQLHSAEEIRQLYERDKVRFTADGRELLTRVANLPGLGGLRLCARITQVAASVAAGEPIDARLLRRVLRSLLGQAGSGLVEHALDASTARVA